MLPRVGDHCSHGHDLGPGQVVGLLTVVRVRCVILRTLASYLAALGVEAKLVVEMADGTETYELTPGKGR